MVPLLSLVSLVLFRTTGQVTSLITGPPAKNESPSKTKFSKFSIPDMLIAGIRQKDGGGVQGIVGLEQVDHTCRVTNSTVNILPEFGKYNDMNNLV